MIINEEEFWQSASLGIMENLMTPVEWHIRWRAGKKDENCNYHHNANINFLYAIVFSPIDECCGQAIVEECKCPAGVK